jgi:hypothetical protein
MVGRKRPDWRRSHTEAAHGRDEPAAAVHDSHGGASGRAGLAEPPATHWTSVRSSSEHEAGGGTGPESSLVNPSRKMVACIDGAGRKPSGSRRRRCGSGLSPGDDTAVACRAGADDHVESGHACRPLCATVRDRMHYRFERRARRSGLAVAALQPERRTP